MGTRSYALGLPTAGSITQAQADITALQSSKADITYVDLVAAGFDPKASVKAIAVTPITLSGTQTIDTIPLGINDPVLVAGQGGSPSVAHVDNGIYLVKSGAWVRRSDADANAEVTSGLYTFVSQGSAPYQATGWALVTADPIVVGTTPLTFTQVLGRYSVNGPPSSVDGRIATFSGTTGRLLQDSGTLVSDLATSVQDVVTVSGTTYTVGASDLGKLLDCTSNSAVTITVPDTFTVASGKRALINILQSGTGQVTIAVSGTRVMTSNGLTNKTRSQGAEITVSLRGSTVCRVLGDVAVA